MHLLPFHTKILNAIKAAADKNSAASLPAKKYDDEEQVFSLKEALHLGLMGLLAFLPALLIPIGIVLAIAWFFTTWFH